MDRENCLLLRDEPICILKLLVRNENSTNELHHILKKFPNFFKVQRIMQIVNEEPSIHKYIIDLTQTSPRLVNVCMPLV
jgi:hypothetical protein